MNVQELDEPVLTRIEKKLPSDAERSLLRDNHILPPKHSDAGSQSLLSTLYRRLFSTRVRRDGADGESGVMAGSVPTETSPLLSQDHEGASRPGHEHLNQQWDAAVATGR